MANSRTEAGNIQDDLGHLIVPENLKKKPSTQKITNKMMGLQIRKVKVFKSKLISD